MNHSEIKAAVCNGISNDMNYIRAAISLYRDYPFLLQYRTNNNCKCKYCESLEQYYLAKRYYQRWKRLDDRCDNPEASNLYLKAILKKLNIILQEDGYNPNILYLTKSRIKELRQIKNKHINVLINQLMTRTYGK